MNNLTAVLISFVMSVCLLTSRVSGCTDDHCADPYHPDGTSRRSSGADTCSGVYRYPSLSSQSERGIVVFAPALLLRQACPAGAPAHELLASLKEFISDGHIGIFRNRDVPHFTDILVFIHDPDVIVIRWNSLQRIGVAGLYRGLSQLIAAPILVMTR